MKTKMQTPKGMTAEQKKIWDTGHQIVINRQKELDAETEENQVVQARQAAVQKYLENLLGTKKFDLELNDWEDGYDFILDFNRGFDISFAVARAITTPGVKWNCSDGLCIVFKVGKRRVTVEIVGR